MSSPTRSSCVAAADARAAFSRRQACHGPSKKSGFGPPSSSTAVVTASRNHRSCATRITAASSEVSSRSSHSRLSTSRWFVGSSRSSRSGSADSARASDARVSSPPEKQSSGGRDRRPGTRGRAAPMRRDRATPSRPRARASPAPRCSGAASPVRGRRSTSPARAVRSSSSIATRSPAPEREYSRSVRPWPRGGRWSWSATRVSFANASSPPWSDVSPTSARSRVVLPDAVRAREREPVAAAQPERDPVEERVAREAPCGARMRSGRPSPRRIRGDRRGRGGRAPPDRRAMIRR